VLRTGVGADKRQEDAVDQAVDLVVGNLLGGDEHPVPEQVGTGDGDAAREPAAVASPAPSS
jgi:hypothetical protein